MSKYLKRCYVRWLPRRLHSYYHYWRLGVGAWSASKYLAAPCVMTQHDLDWVALVAKAHPEWGHDARD